MYTHLKHRILGMASLICLLNWGSLKALLPWRCLTQVLSVQHSKCKMDEESAQQFACIECAR